jgi:hypothetical protein
VYRWWTSYIRFYCLVIDPTTSSRVNNLLEITNSINAMRYDEL